VAKTPGIRSWVAQWVPGWPGHILAPVPAREVLDEGLVIEGQVYDTDQHEDVPAADGGTR
jgi:hypothetical protein